ncbi:MAG TPA: hypothetical protein VGC81_11865, partial [Candidatus Methylomirabilis sp.]
MLSAGTDVVAVDLTLGSIIQTDRDVEITATVRNRGTVPALYTCGSYYFRIVNENGAEFTPSSPCVAISCLPATLDPGEQLTSTLHFQGSAWGVNPEDFPSCIPSCLPFGRYSAVFRFS